MLTDRVSNPGPLTTTQVPYRLRFAARLHVCVSNISELLNDLRMRIYDLGTLTTLLYSLVYPDGAGEWMSE